MQVKITSDGNPYTTKITDMNGVEIAGIKSLAWKIDADNWGVAVATFENVEVDITANRGCKREPLKLVRKWFFTKEIYADFLPFYESKGWKFIRDVIE